MNNSNSKRALITGAAGFVGGYLKSALEKRGYEVSGTKMEFEKGDDLINIDVTDIDQVRKVLSQVKPDVIFHLAGFSSVKKSFELPELCMKVNYDGTKNLLTVVQESLPNSKVLIVGSAEVYGDPQKLPITEEHPLTGENPYALSRRKQESLKDEFSTLHTFWTRSFNHTGPEQGLGFVVPDFASQVADIKLGKIPNEMKVGNLEAERDFSDVRDIVEGYIDIVEKGKERKIYNICSGKHLKVSYVLEKLIELSGIKINVVEDPEKFRKIDVPVYYGSYKTLRKDTGWEPKISFDKTLEDTLNYWLNRDN